ncbi:hypothetical protein BC749_102405 [Flavobacterium araucananum]|uniref:Uncharacterized protein n=1 Tax=Flavobacterium araucananum TaxID=946678 RepID=A0A227P9B9_9FLAO|nr:hypothetical protein [Flavobacterium araucananum]OXG06499.1 hypothetical protein B0A64_10315 [Flavobacterium araucananum]PWK00838.1 hypothetical protein BC749_102405 [Flavobacterium araucananum]
MKKYASLLLFALLLNGCDDGDLTVDTIDFSDPTITAQTCNTLTNGLIYKIKSQESLLIQLPDNLLTNDATLPNVPLTYDINNSTYRVVYRAYDGTVATANICGAIPPTTPKVTEEWQATAGKIVVNSSQITVSNDTDGSTKITGYNYNFTFKNITFLKPSGISQVQAEYVFGDFVTAYTSPSTSFTSLAQQCPDSKQIYNYNTTSALTIDNIDAALIKNEVTPIGTPRRGLINTITNKVLLRSYINGTLTQSYFCGTTVPSTPSVGETWIAENGVDGVSGIIEVTTTAVGNVFTHNIVLKNVKLVKGNSSFKLATNYVLGNLEVVVAP